MAQRSGFRSGQQLGGLVKLEQRVQRNPWSDVYSGSVLSSGAPCWVHVCAESELGPSERSSLVEAFAVRASLIHKNLTPCVGTGEEQGHLFLAEADEKGRRLTEHLERRRSVGRRYTPAEVYTVMSHVCNGLQFAADAGSHGSLSPDSVQVLKSGRVQISGWGFGPRRALPPGDEGTVTPPLD